VIESKRTFQKKMASVGDRSGRELRFGARRWHEREKSLRPRRPEVQRKERKRKN